jgi:hypothetical protein
MQKWQIWEVWIIGNGTPKLVKARSEQEAKNKSGIYPTLIAGANPQ